MIGIFELLQPSVSQFRTTRTDAIRWVPEYPIMKYSITIWQGRNSSLVFNQLLVELDDTDDLNDNTVPYILRDVPHTFGRNSILY